MLSKLSLPSPRFRVLSQEIQKRPFQTDVSISCIPKDEPRGEENANDGERAQPAGQLACLPPARPSWPSQAQSAVKKPRFLTASVRRLLRRRASAARRAARPLLKKLSEGTPGGRMSRPCIRAKPGRRERECASERSQGWRSERPANRPPGVPERPTTGTPATHPASTASPASRPDFSAPLIDAVAR